MNKQLLDGSGMPLPVARTDFKSQLKKVAFDSYRQGLDGSYDTLIKVLSREDPLDTMTVAQVILLVEEVKKIAHANIPTDNK